ncbi:paired mesoderm homeobox [Apostichopus japonicus]|uniref:Paired mesoderm homeobox n=1 Tax=Stichopus japonicus TaxID=307972 RepID=A0A2G8LF07_STIJA|nr:paired mesoderm homeobox [Apostichopus japonicus]
MMDQRPVIGGKFGEIDSSPGVEYFQQMTSDGSELNGENGQSRGFGKSRKTRIIFNAAQLIALERLFQEVAYPDMDLRTKIAERLEIDESRVTVWFQNRRAKYRRTSVKTNVDDVTPTSQDPHVASPTSNGTSDNQHPSQVPQSTPNFVESIPVAGIEFSTWLNHTHSGDQSTVVHHSRHPETTTQFDNNGSGKIQPDGETSRQRRTLDWLQSQNNHRVVSPCDVTRTSPHDVRIHEEYRHRTRDNPQQEQINSRSMMNNVRDSSTATRHQNVPIANGSVAQPYQQRKHGQDYTATSNEMGERAPPNKDVMQLQENHLGLVCLLVHIKHRFNLLLTPIVLPSLQREGLLRHDSPEVSNTDPTYEKQDVRKPPITDNRLQGRKDSRNTQVDVCNQRSIQYKDNNHYQKRKRQHSSGGSGEDHPRERIKRKKKYRKRRKVFRREPKTKEISLNELVAMRRRTVYSSDSDNAARENRNYHRTTDNRSNRSERKAASSFEDPATSSKSEKRTSSSTIFSSTSDSDFEVPYCKQLRRQNQLSSANQPKKLATNDKISHVMPFRGNQGNEYYKTDSTLCNIPQFPYHANAVQKDVSPHPYGNTFQSSPYGYLENVSNGHKDSTVIENIPDDNYSKYTRKDQLPELERASMLNLLFGPKSPDIPIGSISDEDRYSIKGRKSSNEDILSESLKLAQMCNSPLSTEHSDLTAPSLYSPISIEGTSNQQYNKDHTVGHVTAFQRDVIYNVTQKQYTLHYGDKASISSYNKLTTKPRGVIRPVPQKHNSVVATEHPFLTPSMMQEPHSLKKQDQTQTNGVQTGKVTGTVRPWCDDYPRATSNPSQDVSRPVREPVPIEGAPPNKICTMVKDAISPVDLLAKYLTWTGKCYVAQQH